MPSLNSSRAPQQSSEMNAAFDDAGRDGTSYVYFDAQDSLELSEQAVREAPVAAPIPPAEPVSSLNGASEQPAQPNTQRGSGRPRRPSYDFEQPSYFPTTSSSAGASSIMASRSQQVSRSGSMSPLYGTGQGGTASPGLPLHHHTGGGHRHGRAPTPLEQVRSALGRFGRLVGMRVPGATYDSLQSTDDDDHRSALAGPSSHGSNTRSGYFGGGTNQDGVFANLSAKPERRRRRARDGRGAVDGRNNTDNPDDRGSDDDLEDDTLPPTYQAAAADSAPPYWETTILGGSGMGGLYPLAPNGAGWTPGGTQVGEVEDLILEGLPVGNFFGFAWNLAVSMCFQFVGFLLTYLLHTTHAAKCGSRAGLGVTFIQYGFYLHTRAAEGLNNVQSAGPTVDYGSNPDTIGNGQLNAAALFFGENKHDRTDGTAAASKLGTGWWGTHTGRRDWSPEAFAAQGNPDDLAAANFFSADDANTTALANAALSSTDWLAYLLMIIGSFLLFSSIFQYWRVLRWARGLVQSARRRQREENAATETTSTASADAGATTGSSGDDAPPVGFLHRLRSAWHSRRAASGGNRSGEDWVVFPGMSAASGRARREAAGRDPNVATENVADGLWWASIAPGRRLGGAVPSSGHEQGGEDDDDEAYGILGPQSGTQHLSPEERRLLHSLRGSGFLN